jgi:hypothetical protein
MNTSFSPLWFSLQYIWENRSGKVATPLFLMKAELEATVSLRRTPQGQSGSPNFFFILKPHAKFQNPMITPSGRKVSEAEKKKEREKTPLIVDTYFHDSACMSLGPIFKIGFMIIEHSGTFHNILCLSLAIGYEISNVSTSFISTGVY